LHSGSSRRSNPLGGAFVGLSRSASLSDSSSFRFCSCEEFFILRPVP
jgi:hypothetical protein